MHDELWVSHVLEMMKEKLSNQNLNLEGEFYHFSTNCHQFSDLDFQICPTENQHVIYSKCKNYIIDFFFEESCVQKIQKSGQPNRGDCKKNERIHSLQK
jgi:hypothetical protein